MLDIAVLLKEVDSRQIPDVRLGVGVVACGNGPMVMVLERPSRLLNRGLQK